MRGLSSSRAVGAEGAGLDALDTDAMSDSTRRELGMLKKSFHDMASQLERASKASPGIDWKSFEGKVDAGTLKVFKWAGDPEVADPVRGSGSSVKRKKRPEPGRPAGKSGKKGRVARLEKVECKV